MPNSEETILRSSKKAKEPSEDNSTLLKNRGFVLDPRFLEKLRVIELGALNGEVIDDTEHFDQFYPSIKNFLDKAFENSKNPNKNLNLDFLDYGIHVPDKLGVEQEAIESILPYYNAMDSRGGKDWRNVMPITLLPSVLGAIGAVVVNPNLVTSKYGARANELELRVVKSLAKILGYTDLSKIGGISLDGGTKANMYGYLLGLRKAFPQIKEDGLMNLKEEFKFINSKAGHFSNFTNLAAIGAGRKSALRVSTDSSGAINTQHFKKVLEECFSKKITVPTILLTMGTTDGTAVDDIEEIHSILKILLKKYPDSHRPHLHVDAAIGWALSFYNDYDLEENKLHFSETFLSKLRKVQELFKHLSLADSVTVDLHKTGYVPYNASFFIVKNNDDFKYLKWDPEDFKYFDPSKFALSPVEYTLECTRGAAGVFATAMALKSLGIEGYQILLGAGLQYANRLKENFESFGNVAVINKNLSFTCLFRPYPSFVKRTGELLKREVEDPSFQVNSRALSEYEKGFFEYWEKHKKPSTPILDHVDSATGSQYPEREEDYEIPSWKAYLLNPRAGAYLDYFIDEFISLHKEYERQLPEEYLNSLKVMLEEYS